MWVVSLNATTMGISNATEVGTSCCLDDSALPLTGFEQGQAAKMGTALATGNFTGGDTLSIAVGATDFQNPSDDYSGAVILWGTDLVQPTPTSIASPSPSPSPSNLPCVNASLVGSAFVARGQQSPTITQYAGYSGMTRGMLGNSLAAIGDLNLDGHQREVAVGAPDNDRVVLLSLSPTGSYANHSMIGPNAGMPNSGADVNPRESSDFGESVAFVRQLIEPSSLSAAAGAPIVRIAVGASKDSTRGNKRGAVLVIDLTANGAVSRFSKIADGLGLPDGELRNNQGFGKGLGTVDVDMDGAMELMVSAQSPGGGA